LLKKKIPEQHGPGNFLKKIQKNRHISRKNIIKLPRFFKDLRGNFLKNIQKHHHISRKNIMKLPRFFKDLGIFQAFF